MGIFPFRGKEWLEPLMSWNFCLPLPYAQSALLPSLGVWRGQPGDSVLAVKIPFLFQDLRWSWI